MYYIALCALLSPIAQASHRDLPNSRRSIRHAGGGAAHPSSNGSGVGAVVVEIGQGGVEVADGEGGEDGLLLPRDQELERMREEWQALRDQRARGVASLHGRERLPDSPDNQAIAPTPPSSPIGAHASLSLVHVLQDIAAGDPRSPRVGRRRAAAAAQGAVGSREERLERERQLRLQQIARYSLCCLQLVRIIVSLMCSTTF